MIFRGGDSLLYKALKPRLMNDDKVVYFLKVPPFIYSQGGYNISKQVSTYPF